MGAMAIADLVKTTLGPKGMVSFFYLNVFQTNHVQFTIKFIVSFWSRFC